MVASVERLKITDVIVEYNSQLTLFVCLEQKIHTHGQYLNCDFIIALKISFFKELFK